MSAPWVKSPMKISIEIAISKTPTNAYGFLRRVRAIRKKWYARTIRRIKYANNGNANRFGNSDSIDI